MGFKPRKKLMDARLISEVCYGPGAMLPVHRVRLKEDDPRFGMKKGDILLVHAYTLDPYEKWTVVCRESDFYNPQCNVYKCQVEPVHRSFR